MNTSYFVGSVNLLWSRPPRLVFLTDCYLGFILKWYLYILENFEKYSVLGLYKIVFQLASQHISSRKNISHILRTTIYLHTHQPQLKNFDLKIILWTLILLLFRSFKKIEESSWVLKKIWQTKKFRLHRE